MTVLPVENLMIRTFRKRGYEEGRSVSARRLMNFIPEDNPEVEKVSEHAVRNALHVLAFHQFLGNGSVKGMASFFIACDLDAAAAQAMLDVEMQLRGLQERITLEQLASIQGQAGRLREVLDRRTETNAVKVRSFVLEGFGAHLWPKVARSYLLFDEARDVLSRLHQSDALDALDGLRKTLDAIEQNDVQATRSYLPSYLLPTIMSESMVTENA